MASFCRLASADAKALVLELKALYAHLLCQDPLIERLDRGKSHPVRIDRIVRTIAVTYVEASAEIVRHWPYVSNARIVHLVRPFPYRHVRHCIEDRAGINRLNVMLEISIADALRRTPLRARGRGARWRYAGGFRGHGPLEKTADLCPTAALFATAACSRGARAPFRFARHSLA